MASSCENINNIFESYDIYGSTTTGDIINFYYKNKKIAQTLFENLNDRCEINDFKYVAKKDIMLVGYKNGSLAHFDMSTCDFRPVQKYPEPIHGVEYFKKNTIVATKNKLIILDKKSSETLLIDLSNTDKTIEKIKMPSNGEDVLAVGGIQNDLNLYSVSKKTNIFSAKSQGHDSLNLQRKITISGICFPNDSNCPSNMTIATVTRQGTVSLFDPRVQRRALKISEPKEQFSYTCITRTANDQVVAVGSTRGVVLLFDFRKHAKPLKTAKLFVGGVTDIQHFFGQNQIMSCSLDKCVSLNSASDLNTTYRDYVKIGLSNLLIKEKNVPDISTEDVIPTNIELDDSITDNETPLTKLTSRKHDFSANLDNENKETPKKTGVYEYFELNEQEVPSILKSKKKKRSLSQYDPDKKSEKKIKNC